MYLKPTLTDLINLLDEDTLNAVTERLNKVLHDRTDHDKSQLLLEVLESWADAESADSADAAEAILEEISNRQGKHE